MICCQLPIDFIHTTEFEAWKPAFADGLSLAALAKRHGGLPVLANESLHDPVGAAEGLADHEIDVVTIGPGALTHADWPQRVAQGSCLSEFDRRNFAPLADLDNADRIATIG